MVVRFGTLHLIMVHLPNRPCAWYTTALGGKMGKVFAASFREKPQPWKARLEKTAREAVCSASLPSHEREADEYPQQNKIHAPTLK